MDANLRDSSGAIGEGLNQAAQNDIRALDPDGSAGVLNQIIQSYFDDTPTQIAQIRAPVAAGDIEGMMRAAHSMKSTSQTLSAMRVGELARRIESIGRANASKGCDVLLAELEQQYSKDKNLLQASMTAPAA